MAIYIDGPEARIRRLDHTKVELSIYNGSIYAPLEPRRLFPLSGLTRYIALLDEDLKEKAIIRDLEQLDPDSAQAVSDCLQDYYMIPKITAVYSAVEKFGTLTWTCNTDRGERAFRIRNRHSDIKFLYDGRVLIRDTNDNRYEIEDVKALDRRSQRILSGEL